MNKQEILEVLYEMRRDWQSSLDQVENSFEPNSYCKTGFCIYINMKFHFSDVKAIINELHNDLIHNLKKETSYWYITYMFSKDKQALILRLNHLNRTIARLENELNPNHNATFNKQDLIAYRERLDLQLSILPLSLVFTETEKQEVAIIYNQLLAICDTALLRDIEVEKASFL